MVKICPINEKPCMMGMCGYWCSESHECSMVTVARKAYHDSL